MYYPYLRGKQNELFAIKELLEKGLIGDCIQPIIEPIKYTTTFKKYFAILWWKSILYKFSSKFKVNWRRD